MDESPTEPRTMKAIQIDQYITSLSELKVSSIPVPTRPASKSPNLSHSSTIHIAITHTALIYADMLFARGKHQNNHRGILKPPFTLGAEFVGIVTKVDPPSDASSQRRRRKEFKPGDRVWGFAGDQQGAFAQVIVVPDYVVEHVPRGWTLEQVAGLGAATWPVSYDSLVRVGQARKGEVVLVHNAAGGLGVAALQIMISLGCLVIGTVGSEKKAEVIRELGRRCEERCKSGGKMIGVVTYDHQGWEEEVKKLSPSGGVDLVYDSVGLVDKTLKCMNPGSRLLIIGFVGLHGKMEKIAMNRLLLKMVSLIGYRFGESSRQNLVDIDEVWNGMTELLERKEIEPLICRVYKGLESIPGALQDLEDRKIWGKAVIEVQTEEQAMNNLRSNSSGTVMSKL